MLENVIWKRFTYIIQLTHNIRLLPLYNLHTSGYSHYTTYTQHQVTPIIQLTHNIRLLPLYNLHTTSGYSHYMTYTQHQVTPIIRLTHIRLLPLYDLHTTSGYSHYTTYTQHQVTPIIRLTHNIRLLTLYDLHTHPVKLYDLHTQHLDNSCIMLYDLHTDITSDYSDCITVNELERSYSMSCNLETSYLLNHQSLHTLPLNTNRKLDIISFTAQLYIPVHHQIQIWMPLKVQLQHHLYFHRYTWESSRVKA